MLADRNSHILRLVELNYSQTDRKSFSHHRKVAETWEDLVNWRDIERLINGMQLRYPQLRLARLGSILDPSLYAGAGGGAGMTHGQEIHTGKFQRLLSDGCTLVLDGLDRLLPNARILVMELEDLLRCRVNANLYASFSANSHGFNAHWDDHDVLVIQVEGTKQWVLSDATRRFPMRRDLVKADEPPSNTNPTIVEMQPGDVLFLRRGVWHQVRPGDEPSIHLTCGAFRPNAIDYLHTLVDKLGSTELFRRDISDLKVKLGEEGASNHLQSAVDQLLCEPGAIDAFLDEQDAAAPIRTSVVLPGIDLTDISTPDEKIKVASNSYRIRVQSTGDGHNAATVISGGGARYTYPLRALDTIRQIFSQRQSSLSALRRQSNLSGGDFDGLVRDLRGHGLVSIAATNGI